MKNRKIIAVIIAVIILAVGIGIGAYAASAFGTQADPLVAKSYIDNVLTPTLQSQYQSQLDAQVKQLEQKINTISGADSGNFSVVSLASGKTLTGSAGCEIILTDGSASASGSALTDVTSGAALSSGGAITANHLCVVSADGSGVKASGSATLLVRGAYDIG